LEYLCMHMVVQIGVALAWISLFAGKATHSFAREGDRTEDDNINLGQGIHISVSINNSH